MRQRVAELNTRHMRRTSIKIKQDITNTKTITGNYILFWRKSLLQNPCTVIATVEKDFIWNYETIFTCFCFI